MKRIGNIFEKMCSIQNIETAHRNARRGKAHYREVKMVNANPEKYFSMLHELLIAKRFQTATYVPMIKTDSGKRREILKLPYYPDRIVHHCIVQILGTVWNQSMIRDTYACIPGRGIHDGVNRIKKALKDRTCTQYCLKMDVAQFYPSIDHTILKTVVRKKVKDPDVLELIDGIIDSTESGVPIGNYLSQFFGNLYLSGYDHWMKEYHKCRYYFRYCDDVVVLDQSKDRLHELARMTGRFWNDRLKLTLKGNWQVFPVDARGIDYLGYRFFHDYTLLRKTTVKNFKKKMLVIKKHWRKMDPVSVMSSVASYNGWLKPADCRNLTTTYIDSGIQKIIKKAGESIGIKNGGANNDFRVQ